MSDETPEQKFARLVENVRASSGINELTQRFEEQAKVVDGLIHELGNTNQSLNQVIAIINKSAQAQQQPQTSAASPTFTPTSTMPSAMSALNSLPPEMKANLITSASDALARLVQAWKGSPSVSSDPMGEMGKQLMQDLFRATVDDIQQRVYGIRKLPPANLSGHTLE